MTSSPLYPENRSTKSLTNLEGQQTTQEQLNDVYAAGTSDGVVELEHKSLTIPNVGYEDKSKSDTSQ